MTYGQSWIAPDSDTPPSSPVMNGSCKEVSSIQVSVTYTDGSTEVRGFKNASNLPITPPMYRPYVPPNVVPEEGEIPNENYFDQDQDDSIPRVIKQKRIIFEPHEIQTFPQASGYLNAEKIFVVQVSICTLKNLIFFDKFQGF